MSGLKYINNDLTLKVDFLVNLLIFMILPPRCGCFATASNIN